MTQQQDKTTTFSQTNDDFDRPNILTTIFRCSYTSPRTLPINAVIIQMLMLFLIVETAKYEIRNQKFRHQKLTCNLFLRVFFLTLASDLLSKGDIIIIDIMFKIQFDLLNNFSSEDR